MSLHKKTFSLWRSKMWTRWSISRTKESTLLQWSDWSSLFLWCNARRELLSSAYTHARINTHTHKDPWQRSWLSLWTASLAGEADEAPPGHQSLCYAVRVRVNFLSFLWQTSFLSPSLPLLCFTLSLRVPQWHCCTCVSKQRVILMSCMCCASSAGV